MSRAWKTIRAGYSEKYVAVFRIDQIGSKTHEIYLKNYLLISYSG